MAGQAQKVGQTQPVLPVEQGPFVGQPANATANVEIVYGSNYDKFDVPVGKTLGEVLTDVRIKEEIGYGNIRDGLTMVVDGKVVDANYEITGKEEQIELLRSAGEKA